MSEQLGALSWRPVHPASPVLLTKNGPLSTLIHDPAQLSSADLLTHLKFENRSTQLLRRNL